VVGEIDRNLSTPGFHPGTTSPSHVFWKFTRADPLATPRPCAPQPEDAHHPAARRRAQQQRVVVTGEGRPTRSSSGPTELYGGGDKGPDSSSSTRSSSTSHQEERGGEDRQPVQSSPATWCGTGPQRSVKTAISLRPRSPGHARRSPPRSSRRRSSTRGACGARALVETAAHVGAHQPEHGGRARQDRCVVRPPSPSCQDQGGRIPRRRGSRQTRAHVGRADVIRQRERRADAHSITYWCEREPRYYRV